MTDIIQIASWFVMAAATLGAVLNARGKRVSYVIWTATNAVTLLIHLASGLWGLSARDVVFLCLSVYALWNWRKHGIGS